MASSVNRCGDLADCVVRPCDDPRTATITRIQEIHDPDEQRSPRDEFAEGRDPLPAGGSWPLGDWPLADRIRPGPGPGDADHEPHSVVPRT